MSNPNRARGGRAEFSWEKVKEQGHGDRSHYLGASLHARSDLRGGSNPLWYDERGAGAAGTKGGTALKDEISEVKRREEELMRAALGLPPLSEGGGGGGGHDDDDDRDARRQARKDKKERKKREGRDKKDKKDKKDKRDKMDKRDKRERNTKEPKGVSSRPITK